MMETVIQPKLIDAIEALIEVCELQQSTLIDLDPEYSPDYENYLTWSLKIQIDLEDFKAYLIKYQKLEELEYGDIEEALELTSAAKYIINQIEAYLNEDT